MSDQIMKDRAKTLPITIVIKRLTEITVLNKTRRKILRTRVRILVITALL